MNFCRKRFLFQPATRCFRRARVQAEREAVVSAAPHQKAAACVIARHASRMPFTMLEAHASAYAQPAAS